jgi:TonB family protein
MLILALVAWLAVSAPETVTPIPGTRLRLGMTETQLQSVGEFTAVRVPHAAGATPRRGAAKFFGVPCEATLYFRDGRLERANLVATGVAPHAQDYVEDQLRRSKLWRECARFEPGDHVCDWLGAVKIHVEIQGNRLEARVEPPPRPWENEADSARAASHTAAAPSESASVTAAAPSESSPTPATPVPPASSPPPAGAAAPAPSSAPTEAAPSTHSPTPHVTPPAPTSAPAATATSSPAPATAAASPVVTERTLGPVETLAETLRLSLPERNAPSVWPRMTSMPKLVYPDLARRESVQGVVWVLALVDTDGVVRSAGIDRGIRELNDAAIDWVSKARFAPCVRDQRPYRFWIRVAARFTLY